MRAPPHAQRARNDLLQNLAWIHRGSNYDGWEQILAAQGCEHRNPLHDLDLINFGFATPARFFIGATENKHLLGVAVRDLVPAAITNRTDVTIFDSVILRELPGLVAEMDVAQWTTVRRGLLLKGEMEAMRGKIAADPRGRLAAYFFHLCICEWVARGIADEGKVSQGSWGLGLASVA